MKQHRILVYHIGSLGDTLVAVPALWAVRANFPGAHITMLTDTQPARPLVQACDVLDGAGLIDDYITYPAYRPIAAAQLLLHLRALQFDTLVYLIRAHDDDRRVWRDRVFFRLAGIGRVIGMQAPIRTHYSSSVGSPLATVPHMADSLVARLCADGLVTPPAGHGRVDVNIGDRDRDMVARWLSAQPDDGGRSWCAIGPGSKMPSKVWPLERYLAAAERLVDDFNLWPLFFGGSADRDVGEHLAKSLGRGYVPAGVLDVRASMAAMQRCVLFLGNDTGTMHMAAASGVRCVGVFASRDTPGLWYPYGDGHVVLRTPISCEGCLLEECVDRRMECILSISVQQVVEACQSVLG
jgi:heptosyltransferase-3